MALRRDTSEGGPALFLEKNTPPVNVRQDIFGDNITSSVENLDNPAPSNPVVLEDPNLPSVIQCSNPRDARVSQTRDQTDDMSDFLLSLVKMERILDKKKRGVAKLKEMNDLVEGKGSDEPFTITAEFQHKYATLILHLDDLNNQLKYHIGVVLHHITDTPPPTNAEGYIPQYQDQEFCVSMPAPDCSMISTYEIHEAMNNTLPISAGSCDIAGDYGIEDISLVTNWRRRCEDEAYEIVNRLKSTQGPSTIDDSKFNLIAKLTSILTLLSHLQENRMSNIELSVIEEVFTDIRQHLHPCNLKCFEQSVEQLISHIVLNLSPSILPMPSSNSSSVLPGSNTSVPEPSYFGRPTG